MKKASKQNLQNTNVDSSVYSKMPIDELKDSLQASTDGLSHAEANQRLSQFGYNEIPEEKANP